MPKRKKSKKGSKNKNLLNLGMDLMTEAFVLLNQAMECFEQEDEIRRELVENFNRALSSLPTGAKARRTSQKITPTSPKKRNGVGRPPAEWTSHALNFLEHERKCDELEGLLNDLGFSVHCKTLNAFLVRKTNEGVLTRVAMGHYKLSPKESPSRAQK